MLKFICKPRHMKTNIYHVLGRYLFSYFSFLALLSLSVKSSNYFQTILGVPHLFRTSVEPLLWPLQPPVKVDTGIQLRTTEQLLVTIFTRFFHFSYSSSISQKCMHLKRHCMHLKCIFRNMAESRISIVAVLQNPFITVDSDLNALV